MPSPRRLRQLVEPGGLSAPMRAVEECMTSGLDILDAPSPNFGERLSPVSMIVLHYTGMESGEAALARLRDPEAQVSAHYLIEEDGRIFRLVDEGKRAW